MIDEDKVEGIFHRILEAIMPDQGHDNFQNILVALQDAISFQMACACARFAANALRANCVRTSPRCWSRPIGFTQARA